MSVFSRFIDKRRDRWNRHWYGRNIPKAHGLRRQLAWHVAKKGFEIGDYTYATGTPVIRQWGEGARLIVGKYCSVAADVEFILGGIHPTDTVTTFPIGGLFGIRIPPTTRGDIVVGSDVWIATGATILSGVTIGHGAVIGARAVVTKDVAPYEIVAGNPARRIRMRFDEETVRELLELRWWDLPTEALRPLAPLMTGNRVKDFIRECGKLRPQAKAEGVVLGDGSLFTSPRGGEVDRTKGGRVRGSGSIEGSEPPHPVRSFAAHHPLPAGERERKKS